MRGRKEEEKERRGQEATPWVPCLRTFRAENIIIIEQENQNAFQNRARWREREWEGEAAAASAAAVRAVAVTGVCNGRAGARPDTASRSAVFHFVCVALDIFFLNKMKIGVA